MIEQIDEITYSIDAAGVRGGKMCINLPPCRCGQIKNGIALDVGSGGWVIDVYDFLRMAKIVEQHLAQLETEPDALPCGHPREEEANDN